MSFRWKRDETFKVSEPLEVRVIGVPPESELISLGWNEKTIVDTHHRSGETTVRTAEYRLLCHQKHRSRMFIQWRGGPIEPLVNHIGNEDKKTALGVVPRRSGYNSGRYRPAPDDRSIPIDEFNG